MAGLGKRMSPQARLLQRMVFGRLVRKVVICLGAFGLAFVLLATFAADPVATFLEDSADTWVIPLTVPMEEVGSQPEVREIFDSRPNVVWDIQMNYIDGSVTLRDLSLYYFVSALWFPALIVLCLLVILWLVISAFRRMYALVDELMAYLTHDVRTPLTAILGNLELLGEDAALDGEARVEVETALRRAREMEDLTGDLFDTIRLALDPSSIARKPVDLGLLTLQVMDELRGASAGDSEACDDYESAGQPVTVLADSDLLAKAIEHLLRGARFLDTRSSTIDILGGPGDGQAFLAARIPMKDLSPTDLDAIVAHAFDPYYRKGSSNGVSLAFAREIARAHGGDVIAAASEDAIDLVLTLPT